MNFTEELQQLINKHSLENHSDTPDFILAQYLVTCLEAFNQATSDRTHWYKPTQSTKEVANTPHINHKEED